MSEPAITLRIKLLRAGAHLPQRATAGASGFDLYACLEGAELAISRDPVKVPTGIAIEAPAGLDVQIRPRSGLQTQGVMAAFGTLDADYRGELIVTLYTIGSREPYVVHDGDRIAQLVVARLAEVTWQESERLGDTVRGSGGHGSSGR